MPTKTQIARALMNKLIEYQRTARALRTIDPQAARDAEQTITEALTLLEAAFPDR